MWEWRSGCVKSTQGGPFYRANRNYNFWVKCPISLKSQENSLTETEQQQIHQLIQKHRDQSTELERQISDEAHWIRCENQNPHCFIEAVNRSEWRVEKWSGWRESNPADILKLNRRSSETLHIPQSLLFLNESHTVSVSWCTDSMTGVVNVCAS